MKQEPFITTTANYQSSDVGISQNFPLFHSFSKLLPSMREDESYSEFPINWKAKYLAHRPTLVHALRVMCRKVKLSSRTYFLSILYTDQILSKIDVKEEGLGLVTLCCLYIAGIFFDIFVSHSM